MGVLADQLEELREELLEKLNKMEELIAKSGTDVQQANEHWLKSMRAAIGDIQSHSFPINATDTINLIKQKEKVAEGDLVELTNLPSFFNTDEEKSELNDLLFTPFRVLNDKEEEYVDIRSIKNKKIYHRIPTWAVDIIV